MGLNSSGPISLGGSTTGQSIAVELGLSPTAQISLNDSAVRTLAAVASGAIVMPTDFYGKSNATILTINSTVTNYNIFTAAGSPSAATNVILNITSSGLVGGVGATALTVGQFPTGSVITINNSGTIVGYGGAAGTSTTGGNGGDAIKADYPNQTVTINNLSGSFIYGGGGGGGKGGTGGGGQYTTTVYLGDGQAGVYGCGVSCTWRYGGDSYCGDCRPDGKNVYCIACYRDVVTNTNGGTGGNGGQGQGYSQTNTNGSAGGAGGTNAGTGGTGGNGAVYGGNGTTGATGANGNRTSGSAGYAGGTSGRYLVKASYSVTLNNSGTVAGGLA